MPKLFPLTASRRKRLKMLVEQFRLWDMQVIAARQSPHRQPSIPVWVAPPPPGELTAYAEVVRVLDVLASCPAKGESWPFHLQSSPWKSEWDIPLDTFVSIMVFTHRCWADYRRQLGQPDPYTLNLLTSLVRHREGVN